jgi:hypothetical protein
VFECKPTPRGKIKGKLKSFRGNKNGEKYGIRFNFKTLMPQWVTIEISRNFKFDISRNLANISRILAKYDFVKNVKFCEILLGVF